MSIGNLPTQGNKKNNFPYQLAVLKLLDQIVNNTGVIPGIDYELRITPYKAKIAVGGCYSINDFISRTDILNAALGTIVSTLWFNETTGISLVGPCIPPIGNLDPFIPPSSVTVSNLPVTLGQLLMAQSLSVTIASNQTAIPVTQSTAVRTPSLARVTNAVGSPIAAGSRSVTIANTGGANGLVLGVTIKPGEVLSWSAGEGDTLSAISYDGTGTELTITTVI
jgi:hypothetical protein